MGLVAPKAFQQLHGCIQYFVYSQHELVLLAAQAGLLMVGAADGSVRVWRDYTFRGTQRLATAWQVCPAQMIIPGSFHRCLFWSYLSP